MANTTADKLAKLNSTKAALKSAINGSGSTVGDVFSAYPTAITSGKSAIAQAITDKGVTTAANATFQQMAANIGQIESGGGFAGTATVTFVAPNTYTAREIRYIDENYDLVTSTNESVQIPIPQIVYIEFGGERESYHNFQGDCSRTYSSLITGVYYIYGDTTFTASN